jgi:hypothetical protein
MLRCDINALAPAAVYWSEAMDGPDTLICELCGSEALVVKTSGLNRAGEIVVGAQTVRTPKGLFVILDCPIHGRVMQCIAASCDGPMESESFRQFHRRPQLTTVRHQVSAAGARKPSEPVLIMTEVFDDSSAAVPPLREAISQAARPFDGQTN